MAAPVTTRPTGRAEEPDPIRAVRLHHPGRWVAAVVVLFFVVLFVYGAATNSAYQWDTYRAYIFDKRISSGAWNTIQLTFWAMLLGVLLGVLIAVMRLSPNPVLKGLAWLYLWVFRGTPVYVQLVFWGLFPSIYKTITLGVPFSVHFAQFNIQGADAGFALAIIGLGLNEAAYMAEIVRAGISSVPEGQTEAASALGMSWGLTMRRIVLPQAMRVIIPPTGNELISMLKTTSLVVAVPYLLDIYNRAENIAGVLYRPVPLLLVASTWYLVITSILMVGQFYLERYFARGSTRRVRPARPVVMAESLEGGDGR